MPDAIEAMIKIMEADPKRLKNRNAYNITAMSITPEDIAASIRKVIPEFEISYHEDKMRQGIADSWPDSLDASAAKEEWDFSPQFDLDRMTEDMIAAIRKKEK